MAARKKYSDEQLIEAVAHSHSVAGVLRYLGAKQAGGTQAHISRRIKAAQIDTSHFTGRVWNRGVISKRRLSAEEVLVVRPEGSTKQKTPILRRALREIGRVEECQRCSLGSEWHGSPLVLEIDHINSNFLDNREENLQFLCPNCHAQKTMEDIASRKKRCPCGETIGNKSKHCPMCANQRSGPSSPKFSVPRPTKIQWPKSEDLLATVQELGYSETGRLLGVSDNAVRKRLKR